MRGNSKALLTKLPYERQYEGTPTPSEPSPRDARDEAALAEGRKGLGLGQQAILDLWEGRGGDGGERGLSAVVDTSCAVRAVVSACMLRGGSIQRVGTAPP
jgi:hypothetical protein